MWRLFGCEWVEAVERVMWCWLASMLGLTPCWLEWPLEIVSGATERSTRNTEQLSSE